MQTMRKTILIQTRSHPCRQAYPFMLDANENKESYVQLRACFCISKSRDDLIVCRGAGASECMDCEAGKYSPLPGMLRILPSKSLCLCLSVCVCVCVCMCACVQIKRESARARTLSGREIGPGGAVAKRVTDVYARELFFLRICHVYESCVYERCFSLLYMSCMTYVYTFATSLLIRW